MGVLGNTTLTGGTISGNAVLNLNDLDWQTGAFVNSGTTFTLNTMGNTLISTAGTKELDNITWNNGDGSGDAEVTWQSGDINLDSASGATAIVNKDIVLATGDNWFSETTPINTNTFTNQGTFSKAGGSGATLFDDSLAFVNSGTVNAQSGTISFDNGFTQTAGTLNLGDDADTGIDSDDNNVVIQGGSVVGIGNIDTQGGQTQFSGGTLEPGNSPGIINFGGALVLGGTSSIILGLAGTGGVAGTDFDQINAAGAVTLGGSVTLALFGGYTPTIGDAFPDLITSQISVTPPFGSIVNSTATPGGPAGPALPPGVAGPVSPAGPETSGVAPVADPFDLSPALVALWDVTPNLWLQPSDNERLRNVRRWVLECR